MMNGDCITEWEILNISGGKKYKTISKFFLLNLHAEIWAENVYFLSPFMMNPVQTEAVAQLIMNYLYNNRICSTYWMGSCLVSHSYKTWVLEIWVESALVSQKLHTQAARESAWTATSRGFIQHAMFDRRDCKSDKSWKTLTSNHEVNFCKLRRVYTSRKKTYPQSPPSFSSDIHINLYL